MIEVRHAIEKDLPALTEIHNHYIQNFIVPFDTEPQTPEQRTEWFSEYKTTGPYRLLVAEDQGQILGCCYTSQYRTHSAFDQTVAMSIYLSPYSTQKGVGTILYEKLFSELAKEKLHRALAGIALPNDASIKLHKKFGFEEVGIFEEYALKNGKYISSMWLQKKLGNS